MKSAGSWDDRPAATWDENETLMFKRSRKLFGNSFVKISQFIGTKSVRDCKAFAASQDKQERVKKENSKAGQVIRRWWTPEE